LRHESFVIVPDQVSATFLNSLAVCLAGGLLFWTSAITMLT